MFGLFRSKKLLMAVHCASFVATWHIGLEKLGTAPEVPQSPTAKLADIFCFEERTPKPKARKKQDGNLPKSVRDLSAPCTVGHRMVRSIVKSQMNAAIFRLAWSLKRSFLKVNTIRLDVRSVHVPPFHLLAQLSK